MRTIARKRKDARMFCPYCGATNPDDAAFCRSCRRTISIPQQPAPPQQPDQPWQPQPYGQDPYSQQQPQYLTYAAFWPRAGAYLLDTLFATLLAAIPGVLLAILVGVLVAANQEEVATPVQEQDQEGELVLAIVGGFLLGYLPVYLAYFTIANAKGGGWGKRIVGLRILRARDGVLPGYGTGLLRTILPSLIGAVPFAGSILQLLNYLWCIWDSQKQTWHDKIAGTVVVVAK
jgi:uncharacterized RDD family membrane protein YckC/ribosomal protein L40E